MQELLLVYEISKADVGDLLHTHQKQEGKMCVIRNVQAYGKWALDTGYRL